MENQQHQSSLHNPLTKALRQEDIFALGTQFLQGLDKQGLSAIQVRFLAECFITKKHHYLPQALLEYLKNHPEEFQRVIDSSEEVLPVNEPSEKKTTFVRVAALIVLGLGLVFLWYLVRPSASSPSTHQPPVTTQKRQKSTSPIKKDSTANPHLSEVVTTKDTLDTSKKNTPPKKQVPPVTPSPQPSKQLLFAHYIAAKSRFQDAGIRLRYQLGSTDTRTINEDTLYKHILVVLPQKIAWNPLDQTLTFVLQSRTHLSDTLQPLIRIEDNQRKVLKTLTLQRKDTTHWQCQWKPTQPGLYYWQFQKNRQDIQQPTGKIYVGNRQLIEKLYQVFPQLQDF
ncbi:MAG TPA: hypothetical protein DCS93_00695 [Microscillaceae bacterium]|nr:hypothetical protein [Microscillaceae bacterium]